jgi:hypothetical protein
MLDPIQYEFRFFQNTLSDPEPEPGAGAETSDIPAPAPAKSFGSGRLRLRNPGVDDGRVPPFCWLEGGMS